MGVTTMRGERALVTGGAGPSARTSSTSSCAPAPSEIVVLDNFVRGLAARTWRWAQANGPVTVRRGRHPRPPAGGQAHARHRRRLPPGRDPDHAVRRGAAAGARSDGRRHLQRDRGGAAARTSARVVAASSASVYGLAEQFPTDESHHPYANDTLYGAAKMFNEGLLRSFHAMHGLDYVALRYFNVYGPRMDIHGAYTEVLVRWMERIPRAASADPRRRHPDDGLRLRRGRRPRQPAGRTGGRHRRGLQHRQRRGDEPARARRAAARA